MKTTIREYESSFKARIKKEWIKEGKYKTIYDIESEETVPGFPDCLCFVDDDITEMVEFKASDDHGVIKFKSTQPRFYLNNKGKKIFVCALDITTTKVHLFPVEKLFDGGVYTISKTFRVRLPK
jgi:hypothetical protein